MRTVRMLVSVKVPDDTEPDRVRADVEEALAASTAFPSEIWQVKELVHGGSGSYFERAVRDYIERTPAEDAFMADMQREETS